jgi:hypothetical protein
MEDVNIANMKGESVAGNVKAIGVKLFNIMARDTLNERNARLARDMAEMLIAQGVDRDRLANAILTHARRQMVSRARANQIEGFVNNFIRGSSTKLIEGRASE